MSKGTHPTVVVVDDDDVKRYTIAHVLRRANFDVTEASTGAEALHAAEAQPDLMLLDVKLPDIDGFEVCRRIRANPATEAVVVIHMSAAMTQSEDRMQGLEGGADGYITGPLEPRELIATVRSMLRVRQAERTARDLASQWQSTFDAISDGICLLDKAGDVVRCNEAMGALLSADPADLVGRGCHDLAHETKVAADLCARAREARGRQVEEFKAGDRWMRATVDPVFGERGDLSGSVFILQDITGAQRREQERAELLQREQQARTAAETASRAKDEFLATLSHELRTPLNAMIGWLSLLRGGTLDEAGRSRALETIERNAKSQAQLIDDILDASRIIRGQMRLEMRTVRLGPVIEAAVDAVRPAAEAKGVRLQTAIDEEVGAVSGDSERLQQIVWNLVSNAIKFTPKGGVVEVALGPAEGQAEIAVTDTGVGIAPEFLPYVFDRFRQADSTTTRTHGGLGLGLAIVRHLAELHGGSVRVGSEGEGRGARFTVALPLALAEPSPYAEPLASGDGSRRELASLDGLRIMIVDDEPDTLVMLQMLLEQCGAEVFPCGSAAEAISKLPGWMPDVLVSDIGMPELDGFSMMRQIRALAEQAGGRTPSIALTAYARTEDRLRALASGFQSYLSKPADPTELTSLIANLAGRFAGNS